VADRIAGYSSAIVGNPWKNWFFIRLETEDGLIGFGEASLNGFARTVEMAVSELKEYFIGRSPFDITQIVNNMLRGVYSDGGQIHKSAIAAVEGACWDIIGKAYKRPIWDLWGGRVRTQIPLYANGWYKKERSPESFAQCAKEALAQGFTALKLDPFGEVRGDLNSRERLLSLEIVRAVRDAVPPETDVMVEAHCRFDVPTSLLLARELHQFGISWFEEPVSFRNLRGLIEIAKVSPVPIATGENFTTFIEFFELCGGSKNLVLQPDVMNLGGLKAARQVCELGEALNIPVAPHDAQGPISKAMCLQLAAISPAVRIQEDFEPFNKPPWTQLLASAISKKDGKAVIPDSPGLGRILYWDKLAAHPYDPNATLNLYEPGWEERTGRKSP
jgi:galactonate dehydratase